MPKEYARINLSFTEEKEKDARVLSFLQTMANSKRDVIVDALTEYIEKYGISDFEKFHKDFLKGRKPSPIATSGSISEETVKRLIREVLSEKKNEEFKVSSKETKEKPEKPSNKPNVKPTLPTIPKEVEAVKEMTKAISKTDIDSEDEDEDDIDVSAVLKSLQAFAPKT